MRLAWTAGVIVVLAFFAMLSPAFAHDAYTDWKQPSGISCCSETDCRPLEDNQARFERGQWWAWHEQTKSWLPIPSSTIINEVNPTGRAHLCASDTGHVWCFLRPNGGV